MSSNNIFLSISVFLNLVLLALFWATLSGTSKDTADLETANGTVNTQKAALTKTLGEIKLISQKVGVEEQEVGTIDDAQPGTVMGGLNDLIKMGGTVAEGEQTVKAAVIKMANEIENKDRNLQARTGELQRKNQEFTDMVQQKDKVIEEHQLARGKAETDLAATRKVHGEEIDAKNAEVQQERTRYNQLNTEFEQVKAEKDAIIASLEDRTDKLSKNLTRVKRQLFDLQDLSFEIADGQVVFVSSRVVTINLGEADGLQVGNTFSVYRKDNSGIGRRNTEDIKAKIQVTSIKSAHRAEARILPADKAVRSRRQDEDPLARYASRARYGQERLLNPIAAGDPIYSPAFSKGAVARFSIVGLIDFDGDGKSDRNSLRNLISGHGGRIDNEIDDEGNSVVNDQIKITHRTKFLVVGDLGDQDKVEDPKQLASFSRIQKKADEMRTQAQDAGIRIVSLQDFLAYLGHEVVASPWTRGSDYKTQLKAGAASDGTSSVLGDRASQGNVSGLYDPDRRRIYNLQDRLKRRGVSGNTSELYKKR